MKNLWKSVKITLAFCVLLAVGYVFILWVVAKTAAPGGGNAETVVVGGQVVGVVQVGQSFTKNIYFWSRPSAVDYDGGSSGGSNKATTNPEYLQQVRARIDTFLLRHPYVNRKEIPSEMITASGSGLDPDLSPAAAYIQVKRVADARGLSEEKVKKLVADRVRKPFLGLFGTPRVNVLELNVTLDELSGPAAGTVTETIVRPDDTVCITNK